VSADRNSSLGDLERLLKKAAILQAGDGSLEEKLPEVAFELQTRFQAAAQAYPFNFDGARLELKGKVAQYVPYIFCLFLSVFRWENKKGAKAFPARMFEHLSSFAARNFLQGEAVRFAAPREHGLSSNFREAVNDLCQRIGEGQGITSQKHKAGQDDTLDVVAWRDFPDKRPGKLLLFGQCAAGKNWKGKISDLQPTDFCHLWMLETPPSTLLKALFIPHQIDLDEWRLRSVRAKLIFDRCRIAYWSHGWGRIPDEAAFAKWVAAKLQAVRG
jgi:hypothetical protein